MVHSCKHRTPVVRWERETEESSRIFRRTSLVQTLPRPWERRSPTPKGCPLLPMHAVTLMYPHWYTWAHAHMDTPPTHTQTERETERQSLKNIEIGDKERPYLMTKKWGGLETQFSRRVFVWPISAFSGAVIKHYDQDNLQEEGLIWANNSGGIESMWLQAASIAAGIESSHISKSKHEEKNKSKNKKPTWKKVNGKWNKSLNSQNLPPKTYFRQQVCTS